MTDLLQGAEPELLGDGPAHVPPPPPGVYPNVSMADYLAWDCASSSRAKDCAWSAAHCRAEIDQREEGETDALILGSAIHTSILEPGKFKAAYHKLPGNDRRLKAVKDAIALAEQGGFIPLRPKDWDTCMRVREAAWASPDVRPMLEAISDVELSCVADLTLPNGKTVRFKFRLDAYSRDLQCRIDLKTTEDPRRAAFERAIDSYGYHISDGLYGAGMETLGLPCSDSVFLAIGKNKAFDLKPWQISENARRIGLAEGLRLLQIYEECDRTGVWPRLDAGLEEIDLPAYRYAQLAREEDR